MHNFLNLLSKTKIIILLSIITVSSFAANRPVSDLHKSQNSCNGRVTYELNNQYNPRDFEVYVGTDDATDHNKLYSYSREDINFDFSYGSHSVTINYTASDKSKTRYPMYLCDKSKFADGTWSSEAHSQSDHVPCDDWCTTVYTSGNCAKNTPPPPPVSVKRKDFGDAPDIGNYHRSKHADKVSELVTANVALGNGVSYESNGHFSVNADADTYDDAITNSNDLIVQKENGKYNLNVHIINKGSGVYRAEGGATQNISHWRYVSAWIDWNDNKIFDNSEMINGDFVGIAPDTDITKKITWNIPNSVKNGDKRMLRIRLSDCAYGHKGDNEVISYKDCSNATNGYASFGEIEDYIVTVKEVQKPSELSCSAGYTKYISNTKFGTFGNPYVTQLDITDEFGELLNSSVEVLIEDAYTYDRYTTRDKTKDQPHEIMKLIFFTDNGTEIATPFTKRLDPYVKFSERHTNLGKVRLPNGANQVKLVHYEDEEYSVGDQGEINSVYFGGMCYKVVKKEKPKNGPKCYALTDDSSELHELFLNPNVNPLPSPYIIKMDRKFDGEGSAYRAKDKTLYAFQDVDNGSDLYGVNITTGKTTKIVSKLLNRSVDAAEFYVEVATGKEVLYVIAGENNSKLYAFYVDTWESVPNYPKNITGDTRDLSSLAIDPRTGNAYAVDDYNYDNKAPKLYEIDLLTAKTTYKVTLAHIVDAEGLSFASDGKLYLEDEDNYDGRKVYQVNLNNGVLTASAEYSDTLGDMESLSCNGTEIPASIPRISIEKATNGVDADNGTGPVVNVGENITWTYVIKNSGNVALEDIVVSDDKIGNICRVATLAVNATKTCRKSAKAVEGQYENIGKVTAKYGEKVVEDSDKSHYLGAIPKRADISIEKSTNGVDADNGTGPKIPFGAEVKWVYVIKNIGNVELNTISVVDDKLGTICIADKLVPNESKTCTKIGKATSGQYENTGTVIANYRDKTLTKKDKSHYLGGAEPKGSIGNFVWIDSNKNGLQDEVNSGVKSVVVKLFDNSNKLVQSTITDKYGKYLFTNVVAGHYFVEFKIPNDFTITAQGLGDENKNSDVDKAGKTEKFILDIGQNITSIDMGLYPTAVPKIAIETSTNGVDADKPTGPEIPYNEKIIWKYVVTNRGNVPLSNIIVTDNRVGKICTIVTLDVGKSKSCIKNGLATTGLYSNTGKVVGEYNGNKVSDEDPTHYDGGMKPVSTPVADDDIKVGETGKPVTLSTLSNDKGVDANLDPKTVVFTHDNATNGDKKLIVKGEGVWTINPENGNITFRPEDGFTDDPTFVGYTVEDLNGNISNEALEKINYPQTKPEAKDDSKIGERCKAIVLDILKNDSDPENDLNSSTVNFIVVDGWTGTDSDSDGDIDTVVIPNEGKWIVNEQGKATYTPSDECNNLTPTPIEYIVSDTTKKSSNRAKVTVTYPEAEKASLGNFVWFDADKNGKQDNGEVGLQNVTVELYDASNRLKSTVKTDDKGHYVFVNLDAGEYVVKFVVLNGYTITLQNAHAISDKLNSDADKITGKTESITLSEGEDNLDVDAGMYITPKPSIKIVKETNGGDVSNIIVGDKITWTYIVTNTGNETLINIVVTDDKEGNVVACSGEGSLESLNPTKSITCTKIGVAVLGAYKNSVLVTAKDANNKSVTAKDSSSYVGNESPIELGTIGDYVWLDSNKNGIQNTDELPLNSIDVQLYDENRKLIQTQKTDVFGKYTFTEVPSGKYYVKFKVPNAYTVTKKDQGDDRGEDSNTDNSGKTALFTLSDGENKIDIDMGLYPTVVNLGDRVWLDTNTNGIQDSNEKVGVANVIVKLYHEDGTFVSETKTLSSGQYLFRNLTPGNYYVIFDIPNNYKVSLKNQGNNKSNDSDADGTSGKTAVFTLLAGRDDKSIDMGLYQEGTKVGDKVFYDINKNGIQDKGESGVADVEVTLYSAKDNKVVSTTKTATSGIYLFENVTPGEYYIIFTAPVGYTISESGKGTSETDSNPDVNGKTKNFTLVAGTQDSTIDMGVYQNVVSFGDKVFLDTNHNGLQDVGEKGVRDINVTIFSANSAFSKSMLTDENGNYLFTHLAAGEYSVEFRDIPYGHLITQKDVNNNQNDLEDSDGFIENKRIITEVALLTPGKNDLSWDLGIYKTVCLPGKSVLGNLVWEDFNKDGVQDIGERGIANVVVTLFNNDTNEKVESVKTDDNGLYEFAHVDPNFDYYVQFTIPAGFVVSPQDQDVDTIDSDADSTGKTDVITLIADQINSTVDMGIYHEGATIGDRVFFDELNGMSNGIQDAGEQGAFDVKVTLYTMDGIEVKSTRTNASGEYHFTNVPKGRYTVGFSELPAGYIFTQQEQGNDEERDSNVNANGRTGMIIINGTSIITSIDAGLKKLTSGSSSNDIKRGETGKNVTLDVLANDTEGSYNFDARTVRITTIPDGARLSEDGRTLTVLNEGVWRVNPNTGAITFTPTNGFVGDPTPISYSVQDTEGNETGAEVKVNYPPLAVNDNVNGEIGKQIIIYVLENDSNTSSPLDKTSVRLIDPVTGDEVERVIVVDEGTWNTNIDGSITFTPDDGFVANPTPIEYVVREVAGDVSNRATITIIYPDAVDDTVVVPSGETGNTVVNVSENDSSNTVPTTVTIGCEEQGVTTLVVAHEGTWTVGENGAITFAPLVGFVGDPTDIQYTVGLISGEHSNCATVDVRHELLAVDDSSTLNVGGITRVPVLNNDFGSLNVGSVELVIITNPVEGTTLSNDRRTLTVPGEGVWSVNDQGIIIFTSADGFMGTPTSIRYTVESNNGVRSNMAMVTLTEGGLSVVANDDIGSANGGDPVVIDVLANDRGDLNSSSVRIIDSEGNEVRVLVVEGEGTWRVGEHGLITFTGEADYTGTPTPIRYIVHDRNVVLSDTATVRIIGTCVCEPYETSIPAMGQLATIVMMFLTMIFALLFFKEEKQ